MASKSTRTKNATQSSKQKRNAYDEEAHKKLDDVTAALKDIGVRVGKSPVMNGGFDRLVTQINNIESRQNDIVEKVDLIHDAVYDPDKGLFARIKISEKEQSDKVKVIEQNVNVLSTWKTDVQQQLVTKEDFTSKLQFATSDLDKKIVDLSKWKTTTMSILKWIAATSGTAGMGYVIKLLLQ